MSTSSETDIETILSRYPDVSFIGNTSLADVKAKMIADYKEKYQEITGKESTISAADPVTLILYACALQIYQGYAYIDAAAKSGLLKYTHGDYADNLAALRGISRNEATAAVTTIRFTLSAARSSVVGIPAGTRVTNSGYKYFATDEYAEIPAGSLYVDVAATCTTTGADGNDIVVGDLNTLVDPIAYIDSVSNITETDGGADIESDESLILRTYLAPEHYSVAGSAQAYAYWVQYYQSNATDVKVTSPDAGVVDIRVILDTGLPSADVCKQIQENLSSDTIRPLTDTVQVSAPDTVDTTIDVTYYINSSDSSNVETIQSEVEAAVEKYKTWQTSKIGRDINQSVLIQYMIEAGAKRVEVTAPVFTKVAATSIANITSTSITYGGVEDD